MKVKFTKLAALLLAGVALFATGCTDYEVDIQKANQRIDQLNTELNTQVDALKNLLQTTYETIANHDADVATINQSIRDLETALKADYQQKIQEAVNTLNAAIDKKLDKTTFETAKKEIEDAIKAATDRIKAIEDADFQKQIDDLNSALDARLDKVEALLAGDWDGKTVKQAIDAVAQSVVDLEAALRGEIGKLEVRVKANEDAIKELNTKTIPAIKDRLVVLENLTDGGEEGWKDADGKPVTIKQYIDGNVDLIWNAVKALQALTAGFPEGQTIKQYVDAADQALDSKIVSVIAKAFGTEAQMKEMEGTLLGRLAACEALLAGDWGSETVKQYIDRKANELQVQINTLNAKVKVIDDALAFCKKENADGTYSYDLKGEFDKVNNRIDAVIEWASELFADVYDKLYDVMSRIQSIQYVPDYDDLKITTNVALFSQPGMMETEDGVVLIDQPTKLTYQFLPAQYASAIAAEIKKNIIAYGDNPWTYDQLKNSNFTDKLIAYFNVKPVNTRAGETPDVEPTFQIIGIDKVDDTTGEITFVVQPKNVATATYLANGLKPRYDLDLYFEYTYWDCGLEVYGNQIYYYGGQYVSDGDWVVAAKWDDDANDFVDQWPVYGQDPENPDYRATTVPIWNYQDLMKFQARTNYAAQLVLYKKEAIVEDEESVLFTGVDYENHLASPYNVLYPNTFDMEIKEDPYKKLDDGSVRVFTEDEIYQTLPYSALRKDGDDAIGEKPEQDPKGYRVILDQAVPAVVVDGKGPMTIEAAVKAGYNVPSFVTTFKEFTYVDAAYEPLSEARKENFVETKKVYAEIEMNPEKQASTRKLSVGDEITGTYAFTSALGAFEAAGYVKITKPQGSVNVSADIKWVYAQDADTDHDVYYNNADPKYSHDDEPVAIDAETADYLKEALGITLDDFAEKTPASLTITPEGLTITDLSITADGGLEADFSNFEWGKTYTVKAVYDLDAAEITVNGVVTTTDRKRDLIEVTTDKYVFELNGPDYDAATDTYTSDPLEFQKPLFDKFVENGIINQGTPKDFADATAFVGVDTNGKEGHLVVVTDEDNSTFLVIADDNATIIATSPELKEIMGSTQVIYVTTYIGQKVKVMVPVDVNLPAYDFLHLRFYTFNIDKEVANFITKDNFDAENTAVKWWTRVNPSYFVTLADANATDAQNQQRVSNRYALADYDVKYINLAELAFNVVDDKDDIMDEAAIAAANLVVKFDYSVENQGIKALPTVDQLTNFKKYSDLWVDDTVFYYRTNDKKFIPTKGILAILSGDTEFPLPTRFNTPKNSVKNPEVELDYSTYAVVRWTPFQDAVANDITIVLDENKIYREPLFKGMELKDNRPNGVSFYVIKNGEWVVGNAAADATSTSTTNGYINGIKANDAYHITTSFEYSTDGLPVELKKLLKIQYSADGVNFVDTKADGLIPYITYDYTSEVQFQGVIEIPVTVTLQNPWQEALNFEYSIFIKGYNN